MNRASGKAGRLARFGRWACVALMLAVGTVQAANLPEALTPHVRARLVASATALQPGGEVLLGVQQKIIPHWHTYWRNPGDSGVATRIDWQLPAGAQAGELQWPAPSRLTLGPVTNYGYEDEVTIFSRVRLPADLPAGGQVAVRAEVSWLVCREECIPEEVSLTLELPVQAAGGARDLGEAGERADEKALRRAKAQLPQPFAGTATLDRQGGDSLLKLSGTALAGRQIVAAWFFPEKWGAIRQSAEQHFTATGDGIRLTLPGADVASAAETLAGVVVIDEAGGRRSAFAIAAGAASTLASEDIGLAWAVLLAFLGGVVLNVMPCVFPVLSIKALALLRHGELSAAQKRLQGLAYTAGVLLSFALLASVLIALKAGGQAIGWGFQFQSPVFVLAVAWLMFGVGLNLSGLFVVGASAAGLGSGLAARQGYTGSFFTGVLATIVATPCTAPFMGAAVGYALSQPAGQLLAIFLSLGFGLALPYLMLSAWPRLQAFLPRPGAWMERLKEALAFPMYGAAAWLVWVLARQGGPNAVLVALAGMVLLAFAAWLYGLTRQSDAAGRRLGSACAALILLGVLAGGSGVEAVAVTAAPTPAGEVQSWQPYSASRLREVRAAGKPVFVNMTAAWCISCLVNEKVALSDGAVQATFVERDIAYLKGDWTNRDPEISRYLEQFGRSGVPLYVYYPPGAESVPVVLPQLLTPDIVRASLGGASISNPKPKESA